MLDILGNFASILITAVVVAGFIALGAVLVFEIGTMLLFWIKHSLRGAPGGSGDSSFAASRSLPNKKSLRPQNG